MPPLWAADFLAHRVHANLTTGPDWFFYEAARAIHAAGIQHIGKHIDADEIELMVTCATMMVDSGKRYDQHIHQLAKSLRHLAIWPSKGQGRILLNGITPQTFDEFKRILGAWIRDLNV